MSRSPFALLSLTVVAALAGTAVTLFVDGCGSDATTSSAANDGSASSGEGGGGGQGEGGSTSNDGGASDGARDAAATSDGSPGTDGGCPAPVVKPSTGETCVGFGAGDPCKTACGLPAYGYVCFNGGPPGFAGCVQASSTGAFGDTYCCPDDKCVAQPDQDGKCTAAGKSHRFQCPPDGAGGNVAPASGCVDGGFGGSALEHFFCCP